MRKIFLTLSFALFFSAAYGQSRSVNEIIYKIPYLKHDFPQTTPGIISLQPDDAYVLYADQYGTTPDRADFSAMFKVTWSADGLVLTAFVTDDKYFIDSKNPRKSDALDVYISPYRGSDDIMLLTVLPANTSRPSRSEVIISDNRVSAMIKDIPHDFKAYSQRTGNIICYKMLVPLTCLGISASFNSSIAVQVSFSDTDNPEKGIESRLQWNASGQSETNSFVMNELLFTTGYNIYPKGASKCFIIDEESVNLVVYSNNSGKQKLLITKSGTTLFSSDTLTSFPYKLKIPAEQADPDKDTILVFLNNQLVSFHDLFLSPRLYLEKKPGTYENDMRFFEAKDRKFPPVHGGILFIGSSSIKLWNGLKDLFPDKNIIQRGFGGSTAADALQYFDQLVLPYRPSCIFYYEGDNDIPRGIPVNTIISQIDTFIAKVHAHFPETIVCIISAKPSYARFKLIDSYNELNSGLKILCDKTKNAEFVDVASAMYNPNGILRRDIFKNDSLHLNDTGYLIWKEVIRNTMDNIK